MPILDMTLNNPKIKNFFERKTELAPVGELIYIHTHFINPNFLSEIEVMVNRVDLHMLEDDRKKGVVKKIESETVKLGSYLPNVTEETALPILEILRNIYTLCNRVLL